MSLAEYPPWLDETEVTEATPLLEDWSLTEDDLPCEDGVPMESQDHYLQMHLLNDALSFYWRDRHDFFLGGNIFVYYSPLQLFTEDYRGPDVTIVLDVKHHPRKSWVCWQEGKPPDMVIEVISPSTKTIDKIKKKRIYQDLMKAPEFVWYDPYDVETAGFTMENGVYRPMRRDANDGLISEKLGLHLVLWHGTYQDSTTTWLRWFTPEGVLLPTPAEAFHREQQRATQEQQRATREQQRATKEQQRATQEQLRAERLAAQLRALGIDPEE